ncbi:hypothetical protein RJT34_05667 [Clitoria ternatea]|uniref:RNase H type-1 domain-containing protein n=1 Tax=Clitoria ternatea TaxID=43366 RepID=A0AAN9PT89_CLITE
MELPKEPLAQLDVVDYCGIILVVGLEASPSFWAIVQLFVTELWGLYGARQRQWQVQVIHVYREANYCVDFLANLACSQNQPSLVYQNPPPGISQHHLTDIRGVPTPRMISV